MTPKTLVPAALVALLAAGTSLTAVAQTAPAPDAPADAAPAAPGPGADPMAGMANMFFDQIDANKDGQITDDEFKAFRAGQIAGLDADGDGLISKEELSAHYMKMAEAMISMRVDRQIERTDVDGDGKLSAAELAVGMESRIGPRLFDRADANNDGTVTREEANAMAQAMRGRFGDRGGRGGWFGRRHDGGPRGFFGRGPQGQ